MNDTLPFTPDAIRAQLQAILSSPRFLSSPQLCSFLRFVVEETLAGGARGIKQYTIAVRAFGRDPSFSPEADPIVRIEARRLRRALERYFQEQGASDPIRVTVPVGSYVPTFEPNQPQAGDTTREIAATTEAEQVPAITLPSGPSILVLPLEAPAGDPEQVYLADGLTEQLAIGLTAYQDFLIIGPLSRARLEFQDSVSLIALGQRYGARFVLQGQVRKGGDRIRTNVTLIDAVTRGTLWANTFDSRFSAAEMFEFEDTVAGEVASTLADNFGVIPRALTQSSLAKRTDSQESYDATLRYYHYFTILTDKAWTAACDALQRALQLDPNYAPTHAMLADLVGAEYHLMGAEAGALERMEDLVGRALALDSRNQLARQMKAMAHFFRRRRDLFISETARAVRLNPNSANVIASCGLFLMIVGEWAQGLVLLEKAIRLNPHYPGWYHLGPFLNHYRQGAYQRALGEAMHIDVPGLYLDPLARAATLGQLGRLEEAASVLAEMKRLLPKTGIGLPDLMRRTLYSDDNVEMLLDGLYKAGLAQVT